MTVDVVWNGTRYTCTVTVAPDAWAFPVGEQGYPPERWYCATYHGPNANYASGYHTGIDLNLDVAPWGDVERTLGMSVFALAPGVVEWVGQWSGTGTAVIRHEHDGAPLWVRYAHIVPAVKVWDVVKAGDKLGPFDNWRTGDHLHLDMCVRRIKPLDWCTSPLSEWLDPVPVLKAHLDPARVDAMLERG